MKREPIFLTFSEVLDLHRTSLRRHGGTNGLRDQHLLLSALSQPEASFGGSFLHGNLYSMAAAYLFHLTQNHPFVDGNKRIGLAVALSFLYLNGVESTASNQEAVSLTLAVARGELDKSAIAAFLRAHSWQPGKTGDEAMSLQEISARILKKIKLDAEASAEPPLL